MSKEVKGVPYGKPEDGSIFFPGFKLLMFPQGVGIMPFPRCSAAKIF